MHAFIAHLGLFRFVCLLLCIPLGIIGFICKFVVPGYSFTALVCLALIALILFYCIMPFVALKAPILAKWCTRVVSFLVIIGILIYAGTEAVIIHASFGDPDEDVEYMVVLGAKVNYNGPSVSLQDRINAAYNYMVAHPDVIAIVSGGQGKDEPLSEAACMYDNLVDMGIDPHRIWPEDRATSTWENMRFTLDLIEQKTGQRPEKLGVLSSEYHLFRASLFAKACNVDFVGIPAPTSRPSQKLNHFMREVAGVWHYILLGGYYET